MSLLGNNISGNCTDCPDITSSWILTDGTTSQVVEQDETVTIVSGTGILATVSAVNTLTITLNANIGDLLNVSSTAPSIGQALLWNGTQWVPSNLSVSFDCSDLANCSIGNLGDVLIETELFDGITLVYDSSSESWVPSQPGFTVTVGAQSAFIAVTDAAYTPSVLKFEATVGGGLAVSNDFTDDVTEIVRYGVDVSEANPGDFLYYNGSEVTWISITPGSYVFQCQELASCSITNLGDVNTSGVSAGQALTYNATTGNWEPQTISGTFAGINLDADSGTAELLESGDTLMIAGGTGIDTAVSATDTVTITLNASIDDLSDVDTSSAAPSSGDYLQWNGSNWVPNTPSTITDTNIGLNSLTVAGSTNRVLQGTDATSTLAIQTFGTISILSINNLTLDSSSGIISMGDTNVENVGLINFTDRGGLGIFGGNFYIEHKSNVAPQPYNNDLVGRNRLDIRFDNGSVEYVPLQIFESMHIGIAESYYLPNNITGASAGYVLTLVDATSGETAWQASSGSGAVVMSDLTDADTSGVADGDILAYNSSAGEWQPQSPSQYAVDTVTGLTSGTTVTLSATTVNLILVARNGQILYPGTDYTHTTGTTTVTFATAFSGGEDVIVHYFK